PGQWTRLQDRVRAGACRRHREERKRHRQGDARPRLPSDGRPGGRPAPDVRLVPPTLTARGVDAAGAPDLIALLASLLPEFPADAPVLTIHRPGGRVPPVVPDAVDFELTAGARTLPFADDAFGSVISLDLVESTDEAGLAAEQVRVCRPGGLVIVAGG